MNTPVWASPAPDGTCLVRVKAVPGASRSRIVGPLGDALKIQVAAPPEAGAANRALAELIAEAFGVGAREVRIVSGQSAARKTFAVTGGQIPSF